MKVTEHNISNWKLEETEINELIRLTKERIQDCDGDKQCELFYGLITGKLIIMKNEDL